MFDNQKDNKNLTFYDIHCHTMNLSHPSLYAFLKRFLPFVPVGLMSAGPIASIIWLFNRKKILNLLSVMERDVGRTLMAMEDDMSELMIGGKDFNSIIINPLLMDFWADVEEEGLHYQFVPKSIIPQVLDVMNGIRDYAYTIRGSQYSEFLKDYPNFKQIAKQMGAKKEWYLDLRKIKNPDKEIIEKYGPSKKKLLVLPFAGLNTIYCYLNPDPKVRKSHECTDLKILLDKYFGQGGDDPYTGEREDFEKKFGQFNGDIDELGRNYFVGIKVYPPINFDPWPECEEERKKVEYLYEFCKEKKIPIVSHCNDDGYIVENKTEAVKRSHPGKWKEVLKKHGNLKLNIAHFGGTNAVMRYVEKNPLKKLYRKIKPDGDPNWVEVIIKLTSDYPNVYTDISYSGVNKNYYKALSLIIKKHKNIENKILFGSDFLISLGDIRSYKEYLMRFLETDELSDALKIKICSTNPETFLWKR